MFNREIQKYGNGLTHIHYYVPFVKTVSMVFLVRAGSSDERTQEEYGISHFLEHMLFNGSEKYPDPTETERLCASLGLYQNAWTWFSETIYYMQSPHSSLGPAFEILFQRVYFPKLRQKDVDKEIGIIQEEIVMGENNPETSLFYDVWLGMNRGTTYEHKVLGTRESVGSMNRQILKKYHSLFYSPNNSIFVTYGGMKLNEIQPFVRESLDSLQPKDIPEHKIELTRSKNKESKEPLELKKDVDINYYVNITRGKKLTTIDDIAHAMVLRALLDGGQGSLFNRKLQLEDALVSSSEFDIYNFRDYSMSVFESSFEGSKRKKMHEITKTALSDPSGMITEKDFERAKNYSYGTAVRSMEEVLLTTHISLENIEIQNFRNNTQISQGELLEELENVTMNSLIDFAEEYFGGSLQHEGFVIPKN